MARLVDAGSDVTYCLLTSGEAGMPEDLPRREVAAIRER
jgi:LmbE family N-acetylglucosaminyl deacetylase